LEFERRSCPGIYVDGAHAHNVALATLAYYTLAFIMKL